VPHSEQNFAPGAFSWPHVGQPTIGRSVARLGRSSRQLRDPDGTIGLFNRWQEDIRWEALKFARR